MIAGVLGSGLVTHPTDLPPLLQVILASVAIGVLLCVAIVIISTRQRD